MKSNFDVDHDQRVRERRERYSRDVREGEHGL